MAAPDPEGEKDYLVPLAEIVGFQFLLNQYDRRYVDHDVYATDGHSIGKNLHRGWVIDKDRFSMNQFGHPYTGSIYHGFARSAGLDYWESLGYDLVGSTIWEVAGETDPPSLNDEINTTFAGSFLGEALFRTANLVLRSGGERPDGARQAAAFLISPSSQVNRWALGDHWKAADPDREPDVFYWLGVGARRNTTLDDIDALVDPSKDDAFAGVWLDYGMPGKPGYEYRRPFDYFHLEATATSSKHSIPENIAVRGLLFGEAYDSGKDLAGVWGLYGSYDYFSPEIFRVSSTAVSVGTTAQALLSDDFALQGTGTLGIGYTAAGTTADDRGARDYRYGYSPQALVALRLVFRDVAMLDLTANQFFISGGGGSSGPRGTDDILRAQLSLTVRIYENHAVGVQFVESRRDARLSVLPDPNQSVGALSLFYTFLSEPDFGVKRR